MEKAFNGGTERKLLDEKEPSMFKNNKHGKRANMERFRSNAASLREDKPEEAYIDSGATRKFFHRRPIFMKLSIHQPRNSKSCIRKLNGCRER